MEVSIVMGVPQNWLVYHGKSHLEVEWWGVPLWLRKPPYRFNRSKLTRVDHTHLSKHTSSMPLRSSPSWCLSLGSPRATEMLLKMEWFSPGKLETGNTMVFLPSNIFGGCRFESSHESILWVTRKDLQIWRIWRYSYPILCFFQRMIWSIQYIFGNLSSRLVESENHWSPHEDDDFLMRTFEYISVYLESMWAIYFGHWFILNTFQVTQQWGNERSKSFRVVRHF